MSIIMNAYTLWHTRASYEKHDLQKFQHLQESLQNNTFKGPLYVDGSQWNEAREKAAADLFQGLQSNTSVSKLFVHNATLGPSVDVALKKGLAGNTSLRQVTLRHLKSPTHSTTAGDGDNEITRAFYKIPASLFSNHQLQSLHLAHVALDHTAAHAMAKLLVHESTQLSALYLQDIQVSDATVWSIIATAISVNTSLKSLRIVQQNNKRQLKSLLKAIAANKSIVDLHLEDLELDETDVTLIAPLLVHASIKDLSLRKNRLTGDALQALMNTIEGSTSGEVTVPRIWLSRNPLGSSPSTSLLAAIRQLVKQNALRRVCLCNTQLGAPTCLGVLQALAKSRVCQVGMDGNALHECNPDDVSQAVEASMYLRSIWDNPRMMPDTFSKVDFWLRVNSAPRRILAEQDHHSDTSGIMPHLYERVASEPRRTKPDVLFYFLTQSLCKVVGQQS